LIPYLNSSIGKRQTNEFYRKTGANLPDAIQKALDGNAVDLVQILYAHPEEAKEFYNGLISGLTDNDSWFDLSGQAQTQTKTTDAVKQYIKHYSTTIDGLENADIIRQKMFERAEQEL
jgi:hypothetical protein